MHQKQPPAKTAVFVASGEFCAGTMVIATETQVAIKIESFMLSILDSPIGSALDGNCLAYARPRCHKRNSGKPNRRLLWLKHSECFLVLSSSRLEFSGSSRESPPLALTVCQCC